MKKSVGELPVTADGKRIVKGMAVWRISTNDSGKTWRVSSRREIVTKTSRFGGGVKFGTNSFMVMTRWGDNRFFADKINAIAEAMKRNAASHRQSRLCAAPSAGATKER